MESTDFYTILEISQTAESSTIRTAYRRLARLRHPDKNPGDPSATATFQNLSAAYETLSDPQKRRLYDLQYAESSVGRSSPRCDQRSYTGAPSSCTSGNTKPNQFTDEIRKHRQRRQELENLLQTLYQRENVIKKRSSAAEANLKETTEVLDRLKCEAANDERDEASRQGWLGFLWRLTPEEQEERDRNSTARRTRMLVIESRLDKLKSEVDKNNDLLDRIRLDIQKAHQQKTAAEHQYDLAKKAEQRRKQDEQQRKSAAAQWEQWQRHNAPREAEPRRRRDEATRAADEQRAFQAREASMQKEDAEDAARQFRQDYDSRRQRDDMQGTRNNGKTRSAARPRDSKSQTGTCRHSALWNQVQGQRYCQHCQ